MSFKKKVNPIKRKIFKFLTSSIKNSENLSELSTIDRNDIKRVLVVRPNHRLGNQLLITPLIQTIESEFPKCKIDILVNGGLSKILFENYSSVNQTYNLPKKPFKVLHKYIQVSAKVIFTKYDLAITGEGKSNSSKIFVKLSNSKFKIFNLGTKHNISTHISKKPIDNLKKYLNTNLSLMTDYPKLDIKLSPDEIEKGKDVVRSYFDNELNTIAIFTNATGKKKLSKDWWNTFITEVKTTIPNINILEILPKENISQLDIKTTSYYSQDLREIASVIENCKAFIGADSGIMHLACATNTPTFGLFNGSTNPDIYGPCGNEKHVVNTHELEISKIVTDIKNTLQNNK